MRGAFYVATALLIASSARTARTAAESVQIKYVITQYYDKLPIGGSDTMTLPRRSLQGSGDQLETPVAEEERVYLTKILKSAEEYVSEALLRSEEAKVGSVLQNFSKPPPIVNSSSTNSKMYARDMSKLSKSMMLH
ncbi:hypothetical protein Plhal710r2_c053g0160721 [Plasmopara halstedii]